MRNILNYWSYIFRLILVVRPLPSSDSAPSNTTPSLQPHFTFPSHTPSLSLIPLHQFPHNPSLPPTTPSHTRLFLQPHPRTPSLPPTPPFQTPSLLQPHPLTPLASPTPPSHTPSLPLTTPSNTLLFLQPHPLTHPSLPPIPPSHTPSLPHLIPSALNPALTPLPSSDSLTLQPHTSSPLSSTTPTVLSSISSFPINSLVCHIKYNNWQCFRCPCLVMDERPRSDVSDKYSWQCSN